MADEQARATIARLADETLPMLIERLESSELGELEVREDGWRVRLRRGLPNGVAPDMPDSRPRPAAPTGHLPPPVREAPRGSVTSPAVGYFTPRAGVEPGARLRSGDAIGYVDVLGVRHDVVSPIDGTLRSLEAEAGQAVEYGQPIGVVEPEA